MAAARSRSNALFGSGSNRISGGSGGNAAAYAHSSSGIGSALALSSASAGGGGADVNGVFAGSGASASARSVAIARGAGQQAEADAQAFGAVSNTVSSTAINIFSGGQSARVVTGATIAGGASGGAGATGGMGAAAILNPGYTAFGSATAMPTDILAMNPGANVTAALLQPGGQLLGAGVLGGNYAGGGEQQIFT